MGLMPSLTWTFSISNMNSVVGEILPTGQETQCWDMNYSDNVSGDPYHGEVFEANTANLPWDFGSELDL